MILTCPACGTQYVVKDGAIPPGGRQVRCASCRHSWHQDPEAPAEMTFAEAEDIPDSAAVPDSAELAETHAAGDRETVLADAEDAPGLTAPAAADIAIEPVANTAPAAEPADADDQFTPFAAAGPDEPRRRSPVLAVLIALAVIVVAAAAFYYLAPPEWRARIGVAEAAATPLQLMMTHSDRQRLASGNELLAISGRVINPTQEKHSVPPITAQLRDAKGKLVYSWTIAPPAPSLKGGDSAPFYSAEVNVPAGGDELTVTLGAPKA